MAALGAIQQLADLFYMDIRYPPILSDTDNDTRSKFLVNGNNVPGTSKLMLCHDPKLLFVGSAVVIVSATDCPYEPPKGIAFVPKEFAIPFRCSDISGNNVTLETVTPLYKKSYKPTIIIPIGTQFRTTIAELRQYASQNKLYCQNGQALRVLGAVNPFAASILPTGENQGTVFPVRADETTRTGRNFSKVMGFAAPFLSNLGMDDAEGSEATRFLRQRMAAFAAAPEAPAPMRLRDLRLHQLLAMQEERFSGLYNLPHDVLVPVMLANPNIRFAIRKGSNQAATNTSGQNIKPPSNVLVYYKPGQVVKMPLNDMSVKLSELFSTDEEKSNSEEKKQAKAVNKAILNDMDTNNYGLGLVEPDSPEIAQAARNKQVKFHLTRNHLSSYIAQKVEHIRWKLAEMGYAAVTNKDIINAIKKNYSRSINNTISNLTRKGGRRHSYKKTKQTQRRHKKN